MRIFNFSSQKISSIVGEVKRDLYEMGFKTWRSYQSLDKKVAVIEYYGYSFCVKEILKFSPSTEPLKKEVENRWLGKKGDGNWDPKLLKLKKPYSYGLRLGGIKKKLKALQKFPRSRQLFIPVYHPEDFERIEKERVPCTVGYHFQIHNAQELVLTTFMRSQAIEFLQSDLEISIALALQAQQFLGLESSSVYYMISNLHTYADPKEVF